MTRKPEYIYLSIWLENGNELLHTENMPERLIAKFDEERKSLYEQNHQNDSSSHETPQFEIEEHRIFMRQRKRSDPKNASRNVNEYIAFFFLKQYNNSDSGSTSEIDLENIPEYNFQEKDIAEYKKKYQLVERVAKTEQETKPNIALAPAQSSQGNYTTLVATGAILILAVLFTTLYFKNDSLCHYFKFFCQEKKSSHATSNQPPSSIKKHKERKVDKKTTNSADISKTPDAGNIETKDSPEKIPPKRQCQLPNIETEKEIYEVILDIINKKKKKFSNHFYSISFFKERSGIVHKTLNQIKNLAVRSEENKQEKHTKYMDELSDSTVLLNTNECRYQNSNCENEQINIFIKEAKKSQKMLFEYLKSKNDLSPIECARSVIKYKKALGINLDDYLPYKQENFDSQKRGAIYEITEPKHFDIQKKLTDSCGCELSGSKAQSKILALHCLHDRSKYFLPSFYLYVWKILLEKLTKDIKRLEEICGEKPSSAPSTSQPTTKRFTHETE